jgi:hypothetical protein
VPLSALAPAQWHHILYHSMPKLHIRNKRARPCLYSQCPAMLLLAVSPVFLLQKACAGHKPRCHELTHPQFSRPLCGGSDPRSRAQRCGSQDYVLVALCPQLVKADVAGPLWVCATPRRRRNRGARRATAAPVPALARRLAHGGMAGRGRVFSDQCPQPVEADMRLAERYSRFDPEPTSA